MEGELAWHGRYMESGEREERLMIYAWVGRGPLLPLLDVFKDDETVCPGC